MQSKRRHQTETVADPVAVGPPQQTSKQEKKPKKVTRNRSRPVRRGFRGRCLQFNLTLAASQRSLSPPCQDKLTYIRTRDQL